MCKRPVDQHADVIRLRVWKDRRLDVTSEEVVRRLQRLHLQRAAEFIHLRGVEVGHPDVADLSGRHEIGQCAGGRREGRLRVGPVDLVEVDVVRVECFQALVHPTSHALCACVALHPTSWCRPQPALGCDDELVARTAGERPGNQTFRGAEAVALRCVEEVDATVSRLADGRDRS